MIYFKANLSRESGLTLLELLLSMVLLSLVLLAGNSVASVSMRIAQLNGEKAAMQTDVQYVFREFESDLQQLNYQNAGLSFFYDDSLMVSNHKVRYLVIAAVPDTINPGTTHLRMKREYIVIYKDPVNVNQPSSVIRNECSNTTDYDPTAATKICLTSGGGKTVTLFRGELIEPAPTIATFDEADNLVTMRLQLKRKINSWPGAKAKEFQTQALSKSVYLMSTSS